MRVHLVQMDIRWEDPVANRSQAARMTRSARTSPGDLVLLPEMFDTGFSFNTDHTADRTGATQAFLAELATELGIVVLGGTTVIAGDGSPRNRAVAFGPNGNRLASYDKQRLFPLGSPCEADRLAPGDSSTIFRWETGSDALNVAPLICYDLRFPELFGEALRLGAEAYAVIANWPASRSHHWRALAIARAIENQAYVFAVNRCGRDPALEYSGGSLIITPTGEVQEEAGSGESVISADVKRGELEQWRARFPAWRTRSGP